MQDDPGPGEQTIAACLRREYGLEAAALTLLRTGYDPSAVAYHVTATDGVSYFLKITAGAARETGPLVATALVARGIPNVLAPLPTRSRELSCPLDGYPGRRAILFPFVSCRDARIVGLTDQQWRTFGRTLRAVHDSGVGEQLGDLLAVEAFALPSAMKVRRMLSLAATVRSDSPAAARLAVFLHARSTRIAELLERAEELGARLQASAHERVLCHGDIHAANILVGTDGRIHLADWDGPPDPLLAPRERDLMFVVGSKIARPVEPAEERLFFEGYGATTIDLTALRYFRLERIGEDLGEFAESVFENPALSEAARAAQVDLVIRLFDADGDVERAEQVTGQHRTLS